MVMTTEDFWDSLISREFTMMTVLIYIPDAVPIYEIVRTVRWEDFTQSNMKLPEIFGLA